MAYNKKFNKMDGAQKNVINQRKFLQSLYKMENTQTDDAMLIFSIRNNQSKSKSSLLRETIKGDILSPRERRRLVVEKKRKEMLEKSSIPPIESKMIKIIASMVPDEIIYSYENYKPREYDAALMFADVSGFTDLCERYTKTGKGGTSKLTQVLNSYIGAMVQEILSHKGDLLKFSGDAFLAMWKRSSVLSMQDAIHAAIDCALIIQRDYGAFATDVGIILKVKVAIAGGPVLFSLIGNDSNSHYAVLGQPVWDVKTAEYLSQAGDVIASPSAWKFVNPVQYITKPMKDGVHTKVLGIGATWKHIDKVMEEKIIEDEFDNKSADLEMDSCETTVKKFSQNIQKLIQSHADRNVKNLRQSVNFAIQNRLKEPLRRFMLMPVMKAIENDEPMEYLTEMRHVVIVFLNIITEHMSFEKLIVVLNMAYQEVCSLVENSQGILNKVSLFDKDMMFLIVFGLRGLKHELETQSALNCALDLRTNLTKCHNIKSVSVGVTTGLAYCGVVGHTLRREYTVIALCVNKAARLMVAYPDKVTCDKETFLQSKLHSDYFVLMEPKVLKGLTNVGPIYEYHLKKNKRSFICAYKLVGREKEILNYKNWISKCVQKEKYLSSDVELAIPVPSVLVIKGEAMIGKTRLMDEMLNITPKCVKLCKFVIDPDDKAKKYFLLNKLIHSGLNFSNLEKNTATNWQQKIEKLMSTDNAITNLCAINDICDVNFPVTSAFKKLSNYEKEESRIEILKALLHKMFPTLCVLAIDHTSNVEDGTWSILPQLLSPAKLIMMMTVDKNKIPQSTVLHEILESSTTMTMNLIGLDRWHHSTLVCQMLHVQAVPPELEKSMTCDEVLEMGAVIPHNSDLTWLDDSSSDSDQSDSSVNVSSRGWDIFKTSYRRMSENLISRDGNSKQAVEVAVLQSNVNFDSMESEMTMDVIFLKTYDSLNPFEQLLLKCSSVLGEIFSREMLLNILQIEADRRVANAILKLFDIGFLKCAGGDFTYKQKGVLIKILPQNTIVDPKKRCHCIGLVIKDSNKDLPAYAWCGYIRFCNTLFYGATYDLLTENQKKDFHSQAVIFLEKHTKKCYSCGEGTFYKLLGVRKDISSQADQARMSENYTRLLNREFHMIEDFTDNYRGTRRQRRQTFSDVPEFNIEETHDSYIIHKSTTHLSSFAAVDFTNCECEMILVAMYTQIIDHCRKSDQIYKLIEAFIELAELNIHNGNIPLAMGVLCDVEDFVKSPKFVLLDNSKEYLAWQMNFVLGRIYSWRGKAMLDFGDTEEAKTYLFKAMTLFECPFPHTRNKEKFKNFIERIKRKVNIDIPQLMTGKATGLKGIYLEQISQTLSHLFELFKVPQKTRWRSAYLAAVWSLNLALRTNANFSLLCTAYGNMIIACQFYHQENLCHILERPAIELCSKKGENLDLIEMDAVAHLYSSIFLFRIFSCDILNGIDLGFTMLHVLDKAKQNVRRSLILIWLSNVLCGYNRFIDAVGILGQLKTIQEDQDVTCKTWYFAKAIDIHLDTGYTVEPFKSCMKFCLEKGETIQCIQNPEAGWSFFINLWLRSVRSNSFEASAIWYEKVKLYVNEKLLSGKAFYCFTALRVLEGYLLKMVLEMNAKNVEKYMQTHNTIKKILKIIKNECQISNIYIVRYILLKAYYRHIIKNDAKVLRHLETGVKLANKIGDYIMMEWITHTEKAWTNKISSLEKNKWLAHCDISKEINYREIELNHQKLMPYTLPTPINRF